MGGEQKVQKKLLVESTAGEGERLKLMKSHQTDLNEGKEEG